MLQVSKGLSDISCEYELLESENSIKGQSLKIIKHDVITGRFCVDLAQPCKEVLCSAVSCKLNVLHKMSAVEKESGSCIESIQSTLNKQLEQNIKSCKVVMTDIFGSSLVFTICQFQKGPIPAEIVSNEGQQLAVYN